MEQSMAYNKIKGVIKHFDFEGKFVRASEISSGNVNYTYHLFYNDNGKNNEYILQQINTYAFRKPYELTKNIVKVTKHLSDKLERMGEDPANRVLTCIPLKGEEGYLFCDVGGNYWRAYRYILNAVAYDRVERPEHFFEAGRAFGEFQKMLADFPAEELFETIPHFHDTRKRFYTFVQSVAEDKAGRVADLEEEIDFFFERRKMMSEVVRRIERGVLPIRVAHNDTKINNIMISRDTGKAICVLDLDTVMPGSALFDYADAIRYGASTAAEDETDLSKISLDMDLFRLFTGGFLSEVGGILTPEELTAMPLSLKVMTCELAMRFLTDYIDGDLYFKVNSPEHNYIRARAQMKLLTDIEEKYDDICAVTTEMIRKYGR